MILPSARLGFEICLQILHVIIELKEYIEYIEDVYDRSLEIGQPCETQTAVLEIGFSKDNIITHLLDSFFD